MKTIKLQLLSKFLGCCIMLICFSCKKFLEIPPPANSLSSVNVYSNDAGAKAAVLGIYTILSGPSFLKGGTTGLSMIGGLSADELILYPTATNIDFINSFRNSLNNQNSARVWKDSYSALAQINSAIEGLEGSATLSPSVRNQLIGETKFLRAYTFFYLVNLYGNVPLTLNSDWRINNEIGRTSIDLVYDQIIKDLGEAQSLLGESYLNANLSPYSERLRPNKWAAVAMLARVYLYRGDYVKAQAQADIVIGNTSLFSIEPNLDKVFLKNSSETIWQLGPGTTTNNTYDGNAFILTSTGFNSSRPVYLSSFLLNAFEANDLRRTKWVSQVVIGSVTYQFPFKYKVRTTALNGGNVTEYMMMLRLSEMFLIRAEARAQQNNIAGSQSDLNIIRARAGLPNTTANDKPTLLSAILHERQIELFTELGHRWLDLKRTETVDAVMTVVKPAKANGALWQSYQQYFPIELADITLNPQLSQTPGY